MEDLEQFKQMIRNGETVRLSSNFTKAGTILVGIFVLGFSFFLLPLIFHDITHMKLNLLLAGIMMLGIIAFALFQLIYAAEATLDGKQLFLKKVIGGSSDINVNQIEKISSFTLRRTKYTILKFIDNQGIGKKVLIMNSNSSLFGVEPSAGDVIKMAQQM